MDKNTFIRENYLQLNDSQLAHSCGLSENAVRHRRRAMGLKRPQTIITIPEPVSQRRELIEAPAVSISGQVRRWIILSDMQVPFHDVKTLAVVEAYMGENIWDGYLNIGDFMDFDSISSFNVGKPGLTENRRLAGDFDEANKILDRHQALVRKNNPDAQFVLLEGNHEERLSRYLEQNPMFKGLVSIERELRLQERGFEYVKSWSEGSVYKIGKASFMHGRYTNKYHAAKMVDTEEGSIFYGHTHDMMCIPKSRRNKEEIHVGQSIGCLCEIEQAYMQGKPSNWNQGFMVLYVFDGGRFTYYTPRIFSHTFVAPDGKLYQPTS